MLMSGQEEAEWLLFVWVILVSLKRCDTLIQVVYFQSS